MKQDLFIYLNETKKLNFQILDDHGDPIDFDTTDVLFQTAREFLTCQIEMLKIGSGITVLDPIHAIVELTLTASDSLYCARQHVFQLSIQDKNTKQITVCLSGRLFIDPSIGVY